MCGWMSPELWCVVEQAMVLSLTPHPPMAECQERQTVTRLNQTCQAQKEERELNAPPEKFLFEKILNISLVWFVEKIQKF